MKTFDPKRIPDVAERFTDDVPLVFYQGGFYLFNGTYYSEISKETVVREIVDRFAQEKVRYLDVASKKYRRKQYAPSIHWARGIREYLAGSAVREPPCWLDEEPFPAHEILAVRNGLLHIPTRTLIPHTRNFFNLSVSKAGYFPCGEPLRYAPAFASMLQRVWDEDESRKLFQDILGYLLTPDPPGKELQKLFLFRGATRGGKGTCVRIIEALAGPGVCAQIAPENVVKSTFALHPLIDHRIGLLGDLRINQDREVAKKLLPLLLRIVGGDPVQIDRKFKAPYHARLNTKLIIESNTDLGIHDATGAVAARILPLVFPHSFAGKEDPDIPQAILDEADYILLWALSGWDRVNTRRGKETNTSLFQLSAASQGELEEIRKQGSIIIDFLASYKEDPGGEIELDELFKEWKTWAVDRGVYPKDPHWLRQEIRAVWARVTTRTSKPWGQKRRTVLCGLKKK